MGSTASSSVSNGSGVPGFGPDWKGTVGPGPGQEPPSNLTRFVLAGLFPSPDINRPFFGQVEPRPRFQFTVPTTLAKFQNLSSDRIVT